MSSLVLEPLDPCAPERTARLVLDGAPVGLLRYTAWPGHLVVHALTQDADGADVGARAIEALLDGATPERITLLDVRAHGALARLREGPLGAGFALSGTVGPFPAVYDPLRFVTLAARTRVTATWHASLEPFGAPAAPSRADVPRWLTHDDPVGRVAAIRRLALDPALDPALVADAHHLALLAEATAIRQFAALHLGGFTRDLHVRADPARLVALLRDPLEALRPFDLPRPTGGPLARVRRDARYAVAWALGNLVKAAGTPGACPWVHDAAAALPALLDAPRPDAVLHELVVAELTEDDVGRWGLGALPDAGLGDLLRFAVLRDHALRRLGLAAGDRFDWLVGLAPRLAADAPRITAPCPDLPLPRLDALPVWLARPALPDARP